jgi:protein NirF
VRDDDAVIVYDPATFAELARIRAEKPSGIFLASRAFAAGF